MVRAYHRATFFPEIWPANPSELKEDITMETVRIMLDKPLLAVMAVLLMAVTVSMLAVQEAETQQPQETQLTDAKLEAVAKAYLEVLEIQKTYAPRIEQAQSAEEAERIEQDAMEAMAEAIERVEGVTVEEYNNILTAAQTDEQLRQRLGAQIHKIQQENTGGNETTE
jgi:hypothetical protein